MSQKARGKNESGNESDSTGVPKHGNEPRRERVPTGKSTGKSEPGV